MNFYLLTQAQFETLRATGQTTTTNGIEVVASYNYIYLVEQGE